MPDVSQMDEATKKDALQTMGWSMASQLGLNLGFSEAELAIIFEGMKSAAKGDPAPANLEQMMPNAQAIYMEKRQNKQKADDAKAEEDAKVNIEAAKPFFDDLEAKAAAPEAKVKKTASGVYYEILAPGNPDKKPTAKDRVKMLYKGTLIDGTVFDERMDAANPAVLGLNRVVPGFGEGVQLVGEGGKIKLYIPSHLGYGNRPRPGGKIKPGDALIFEVEAMEIVAPPPPPNAPRVSPPNAVAPAPGAAATPGTPPTGAPPTLPPNMTPPGPPPNIVPPPPPNMKPPAPPANMAPPVRQPVRTAPVPTQPEKDAKATPVPAVK